MSHQYKEIYAWNRIKCGRVLLTEQGIKRHKETCKYTPQCWTGKLQCVTLLMRVRRPPNDRPLYHVRGLRPRGAAGMYRL